MSEDRSNRKTKVGVVTSDKMDKTIVVGVEQSIRHSLYGKSVREQRNSRHTMKTTSVKSEIK